MESWYKTEGLSVNSEKTEVVFFARKRKTNGIVRFSYQGVKLNLIKEVNYLDIILDDKLKWKAHVETQMTSAYGVQNGTGKNPHMQEMWYGKRTSVQILWKYLALEKEKIEVLGGALTDLGQIREVRLSCIVTLGKCPGMLNTPIRI